MTTVWFAILFCANILVCSPNGNTQLRNGDKSDFPTKEECQQFGVTFLTSAGFGQKDKVIVCVEGIRP
jgi:hypothetical protein